MSALSALLPDLGRRTLVMGILNVTPDSFSDGGLFVDEPQAAAQAARLVAEGAALLDIGGESTRPGHVPVPADEEQARVLPVIRRLAPRLSVPISIDTYKASTARVALEAGARLVNDVWGLQRDPDIARVAADQGAPVIVMHNREAIDPGLDIVAEMLAFFERSLAIARWAGIPDGDIVLDPGIGFGKSWEQHLEALRRLPASRANRSSGGCTIARPGRRIGSSARSPPTRWPPRSVPTSYASTTSRPTSTRCGRSMR